LLRLEEFWTRDFWLADDGRRYHIYFLKARRSLGDPDLRHVHASIGHATSADLIHWDEAADALAPGAGGALASPGGRRGVPPLRRRPPG
jgi:beta-fructofuranosidase